MLLAACLLFGVSVYLVVSIENLPEPDSGIESAPARNQIEEGHLAEGSRQITMLPAEKELPPLVVPTRNEVWDQSIALSTQEESTQTSSGYSWVRLKFNVSTSGEVQQITIIESCLKVSLTGLCIDDDIHDDYAIEQIRMNRYDALGEMEEIVFIPPEY